MNIVEFVKIVVLGIVEGITEWLPISSTGHMILVDQFMQINASEDFKEMFFVVIQLGAILSVVVLYFKKLFPFDLGKNPFIKRDSLNLWSKIIVACIPAAIIGLKYDDLIDSHFYNYQTVAVTLILYGVFFILIENLHKKISSKINTL